MTRRVLRWQAEKARTAKAIRDLPRCEYTEGCTGPGLGVLAKQNPFRLVLACPACARKAKPESLPNQPRDDAKRET